MSGTSLHIADGLTARETLVPDISAIGPGYAKQVSSGLLEKLERYGNARIEAATNLTQEIALLRMLVGERLAQWEQNQSNLQAYVLLCDAIEKVQRICLAAARIQRDLTANARNDLFLLGSLAQTLVALQAQGHISEQQAQLIENSMGSNSNYNNNSGPVVSTMPTRITTDQIAQAMDATVPYVNGTVNNTVNSTVPNQQVQTGAA